MSVKFRWYFSLIYLFLGLQINVSAQNYDDVQNHQCLKCHTSQSYSFENELKGTVQKRLMSPYLIIDTTGLRNGVHNVFDCTDCHSYEYTTYPHPANIKLEPLPTCLDCHGGDETFATYQFERIQEEFQKSIHYEAYGDNFTCSKCHDPHTYLPVARNAVSVGNIVDYSNQMCLHCHNDMKQFHLVSGRDNPRIVEVHEWLPNQQLHFENVRCIECHTEVEDGLMVPHNILKKENAVRKCVECHSANSKLQASLYKYQNLQQRAEGGNLSVILANESYVIGATKVPFLNTLGIIIFVMVLAGISVHVFFRIKKSRN